jgi:hypothetical protein
MPCGVPGKWWIGRKSRWIKQFIICHPLSRDVLPDKERKSNIKVETCDKNYNK